MQNQKQKANCFIVGLLLFFTSLNAEVSKETYNNIAMGVLLENNVDSDLVEIIEAKPLPQNKTILQIAYKVKENIVIAYAINSNSILIGGQLVENGKIHNLLEEYIDLVAKPNFVKQEDFENLKKYAVELFDKKDNKEDLYIVMADKSKDFDYLFIQQNYKKIAEKYNIYLILMAEDDEIIQKTKILNFMDSPSVFKNAKKIKEILMNTENTNQEEKNGIIPMYFLNKTRVNPINITLPREEYDKKN